MSLSVALVYRSVVWAYWLEVWVLGCWLAALLLVCGLAHRLEALAYRLALG